jgi:hypothetical protein
MKYLGILVSDVKLGMVPLSSVAEKVSKRVPPWKGKHMPSGGRLILTNSCLSSLPTYTMGFYLVPLGIHRKMDHVRAKFFWRGAGGEFKYHMVRWPAVCHPKMFGGRGIINTQIFNECLMVKWIWKIYNQAGSLWVRLLKAKYLREGDFYKSKDFH